MCWHVFFGVDKTGFCGVGEYELSIYYRRRRGLQIIVASGEGRCANHYERSI
jgi:hypothetical protein